MAASTITRDVWTNDSGSATAPNGDGTVLNNSALQNNIYARIDQMFSGAGAYTTLEIGGLFTADGFGTHNFVAGGTGTHQIVIQNTTAGTGNLSALALGNDALASAGLVLQTSTTYTAAGDASQDGLLVRGGRVGGLNLSATNASGVIRLFTGGTVERGRMSAAGNVIIGNAISGTERRMMLVGAGEASAVSDAGAKTGALLLSTTSGGLGDGGSIEFGAGYGVYTQPYYAAIKAYSTSGSNNTLGDLVFLVRAVSTDSSLTETFRMKPGGIFQMNKPTTDAFMTQGLVISQGANSDEILAAKSTSQPGHGMTSVADTDTYCCVRLADPATGGSILRGLGTSSLGVRVEALSTTTDNTQATTSLAPLEVRSAIKSGTTVAALGGTNNLAVFRDLTTTRFIFRADGSSYEHTGTAWTTFDRHNDFALIEALEHQLGGDVIDRQFRGFIKDERRTLVTLGLISKDGSFINRSRGQNLLFGAMRQAAREISTMKARISALESR